MSAKDASLQLCIVCVTISIHLMILQAQKGVLQERRCCCRQRQLEPFVARARASHGLRGALGLAGPSVVAQAWTVIHMLLRICAIQINIRASLSARGDIPASLWGLYTTAYTEDNGTARS